MFSWVASLQPAVIGAVLIWAAGVKLFSRHAAAAAGRSALPRLVGEKRALPAYRALGIVELALGAALLLPPVLVAEAGAAVALHLGFLGYLTYARISVPESSCGCMSAQRTPIGARGFARAGALLIAALAATTATTAWHQAVLDRPALAVLLIVAEVAAVAGLSSELDAYWLLPMRRLRVRLTHPLRNGSFDVPLASSVEQLLRSGVFRQVSGLLTSDVREHWDEDDWRIVCYSARYQGQQVSAVFAVPRLRYEPGAVRVALVDEETGTTVLSLDPISDPAAEAIWPVGEPAHAT